MVLNVTCPHCGALLDVTGEWLGQQLECGGCSSVFACPDMAEEAPPEDGNYLLRDKPSRRDRARSRTRAEEDERWAGYEAYSQDDDPDSYISKKRGPGYATASMVLGILSLTLGTPLTVLTCGFGGFIQIIMSIVGIILGYLGIRSESRGTAIAGMVMNVLGALFAVLWMTLFSALISGIAKPAPPPPPPAPVSTPATWKTNQPPPKPKW